MMIVIGPEFLFSYTPTYDWLKGQGHRQILR